MDASDLWRALAAIEPSERSFDQRRARGWIPRYRFRRTASLARAIAEASGVVPP